MTRRRLIVKATRILTDIETDDSDGSIVVGEDSNGEYHVKKGIDANKDDTIDGGYTEISETFSELGFSNGTYYVKVEDGKVTIADTLEINAKFKITAEGGYAVRLTNKTGASSVKGTLLCASDTTDNAVIIAPADCDNLFGVMYENGVADGSECWVIVGGIAQVLLKDGTASTRTYWARISVDTDGRADITSADVPGGGVVGLDEHKSEIGHCIESKTSGTDVLAYIIVHFN
jgi:hypothetical protein